MVKVNKFTLDNNKNNLPATLAQIKHELLRSDELILEIQRFVQKNTRRHKNTNAFLIICGIK